MNEHHLQSIPEYLQQGEVQARILEQIQQARLKMAVTIGGAARLFNFSESQLREWERRGLLQTERPLLSQESEGGKGHRQYSQAELFKLAIIRDLVDHGYSPGDIPVNVQRLWSDATGGLSDTFPRYDSALRRVRDEQRKAPLRSIEERLARTDEQEFWRYFVAQVLRLCLLLICEDVPGNAAGLILPLEERNLAGRLTRPADIGGIGRALIGWRSPHRSFYLFLEDTPAFQYPTDYRLQALKSLNEEGLAGDRVLDNTFLVLARDAGPLRLAPELLEVVRRLLELVYQRASTWELVLGDGRRDWLYQAHDLEHAPQGAGDRIFNALLERVIDLGRTPDGSERWRFCALLLPDDPNLPLQQQSLVVRAQTQNSPYHIGLTRLNPQHTMQMNSITVRAFQGGQMLSIPTALPGDSMLNPQQVSVITSTPDMIASGQADRLFHIPPAGEKLHAALAVPVAGEFGISNAVFYIQSFEANSFTLADQRVLRVLGRMLEELLMASRARNQGLLKRDLILNSPAVVDRTFSEFAVEADFIGAIDQLLCRVLTQGITEEQMREEISILSVEIDNQTSRAMKYGNRIARNLSYEVGRRVRGRTCSAGNFQVFHVSADKYYILLPGVGLAEARGLARQIQDTLSVRVYSIQPLSGLSGRATLRENMLELCNVTAHMSVSSYPLGKLRELLQRYSSDTAIMYVRTLILAGIDAMLERGNLAGGNCIVAWDPEGWGYEVLPTGT